MDKEYELEKLSDSDLLLKLAEVLKQSRRVESVLVAHIAEVDARRLFVSQASSSMHKYCTDVLHLSGAEAFLRITAARASRPTSRAFEDARWWTSSLERPSRCWHRISQTATAKISWLEQPTRPRARSRSWWQRLRRSRMWRPPSGSFRPSVNDKRRMGKNRRKGKVRSEPTKTLRQAPKVLRPERVLRLMTSPAQAAALRGYGGEKVYGRAQPQ